MKDICEKCVHAEVCRYSADVLKIIDKEKELIADIEKLSPVYIAICCDHFEINEITNIRSYQNGYLQDR